MLYFQTDYHQTFLAHKFLQVRAKYFTSSSTFSLIPPFSTHSHIFNSLGVSKCNRVNKITKKWLTVKFLYPTYPKILTATHNLLTIVCLVQFFAFKAVMSLHFFFQNISKKHLWLRYPNHQNPLLHRYPADITLPPDNQRFSYLYHAYRPSEYNNAFHQPKRANFSHVRFTVNNCIIMPTQFAFDLIDRRLLIGPKIHKLKDFIDRKL